MAGPIAHGVSKALREARDKGAYSRGGRGGSNGPPGWMWALIIAVLVAAIAVAAITLR